MKKLIQSHRKLILSLYLALSFLFVLKVAYEASHQKSFQPQIYSGDRLK